MANAFSMEATPEQPFYHEPILLEEVVHYLAPSEVGLFADGTLGGGGHTEALLRAGATVKGIDRDADARTYASERLARFGNRFEAVAGCFSEISQLAEDGNWGGLDGILLDLGVSSHQLDVGERGFSFRFDGPLDMRMGDEGRTAADLVNTWDEAELRQIFWDLGEEKSARKITAWIVEEREKSPFETTLQLADGIEKLIGRRGRTHPATKIFQALRMEVNDELGELRRFLEAAPALLKVGGRLAIITFHSLEDRIVKQAFRDASKAEVDRPEWPAARPNPDLVYRLLTRKGIAPGGEEISRNSRSRSSRLRVVERIPTPTT
ncbi:MAG: 16S rRNA (cytosine1402-N4)-methyltransferase [Paracoccaceae bacterium]|jgi:16S rRNA (cytosine1402-N4)-methyltransferase